MTYDTAKIRQFLTSSFSDQDLDYLCYDHFREAYNLFSAGMSKPQKIQALIEYLERRGEIERLMTVLERERPEPFKNTFRSESKTQPPTQPLNDEHAYQYYAARYGMGYNNLAVLCTVNTNGSGELHRRVDVEAYSPIDTLDTYLTVPERASENDIDEIQQIKVYSHSSRSVERASEKNEPGKLSVLVKISPALRPGDRVEYHMIQKLPPQLFAINLPTEEIQKRKPFDYSGWAINRPTRKFALEVIFPLDVKPVTYSIDVRYTSASSFPSERLHHDELARLKQPALFKDQSDNYHLKLEVDYPMIGLIYMMRWPPIENPM